MTFNSSAKPGRADEYSEWCRTQHFADVLRVPGVVTAKRFRVLPKSADEQARFISLFELECDDPAAVVAEMRRRSGTAEMPASDSYDPASVSVTLAEIELDMSGAG
jgi:hypothetical protein